MAGINKVILVGRSGAQPETKNGVTKFSIATSDKYKDKTGNPVEKTEWHSLTFFGRLGEIASQYVTKGSLLYIEGKLQTSKWQGTDGKDNYKTEVIVSSMQMLGSKGDKESSQPLSSESTPSYDYMHTKSAAKKNPMYAVNTEAEDDLPF